VGTWPVLVGDEQKAERNILLSSPIILYDYPKVAPESAGPLFDGTEIDEILTLRILTMTDQEKLEMRQVHQQARALLERTESLPADSLLKMHGTLRQPITGPAIEFDDLFGANVRLQRVTIDGTYVQAGSRVRLRPTARADIIDLALAGQTATVEAVEQDAEKRVHLAVVLDHDPGKDLGLMRQPGHRFFYGIDEVEPLQQEVT
jgi:hydrogenase maturation protease